MLIIDIHPEICNIPAFLLAIFFFALGGYALIKFILLSWIDAPKKTGKGALLIFLLLVTAFASLRCAFFTHKALVWESFGSCEHVTQPTIEHGVWDIFGTLPSALFLLAFSVNIGTLANSYSEVRKSRHGYICNIILVLCNTVVDGILTASYLTPAISASIYLFTLAAAEFLIANLCLLYAWLFYGHSTDEPNPMFRLVCASGTCWVCFCIKTALIFVVQYLYLGVYTPFLLLAYFLFSEIAPVVVMIFIFETSKKEIAGIETGNMMSQEVDATIAGEEEVPGSNYKGLVTSDPHSESQRLIQRPSDVS